MPEEFNFNTPESPFDPRTITHDDTFASPVMNGGVDYLPTDIEHQHKVGICTGISIVQNAQKVLKKRFSPDFQYLLQKKYIDMNWTEGSSLLSGMKASKNYGFLPIELFPHVTEQDRYLPYSEYIAKLQAIPDSEVQRLIALCTDKLVGYAQVDVSSAESVGRAINSSQSGIITRYVIGSEWWTSVTGTVSWDPKDINPLRAPQNSVGGHAIIMSKFDYKQGLNQVLANTWGTDWNKQGLADINWDTYKLSEAWIPYYNTAPVVAPDTPFNRLMKAVKDYQISKGITDFQNETDPKKIKIGPKTLSAIAKDQK